SGGVLAADAVDFTYQAANFSDSAIGDGKTVTVTGIRLGGSGAGNYLLADPSVTTTANIIGAQPSFYGVGNGLLAEVHGATDQRGIATPYGLAPRDPVGVHAGNDKRRHHVVERNRSRADFTSGMALKVIDGGVRLPGHTP
ncbi:MAG TPA: YDG domain-containing protein, partial [Gammaproteobacteria bacterium]|nr:YDG domain-containing protein [Gammaproteobacteria bacterium]